MLQIDQKIKELLRLKAKINLYSTLLTSIKAEVVETSPEHAELTKEHPGLLKEFCAEVEVFCNGEIGKLGNSGTYAPEAPKRAVAAVKEAQAPEVPQKPKEPSDPLRFLLKWKHLDNKRVSFETRDGIIFGKVVGLVVPFLRVETEINGAVIDVDPLKINIANN